MDHHGNVDFNVKHVMVDFRHVIPIITYSAIIDEFAIPRSLHLINIHTPSKKALLEGHITLFMYIHPVIDIVATSVS